LEGGEREREEELEKVDWPVEVAEHQQLRHGILYRQVV
jgi:hypothetical protein